MVLIVINVYNYITVVMRVTRTADPWHCEREFVQLAAGTKKPPKSSGEVTGHGDYPANYSCYYCGRLNFVPGGIYAFYYWFCYRLNLAP